MVEQMILIHLVEGSIPSHAAKQHRRWKPPFMGGFCYYWQLEYYDVYFLYENNDLLEVKLTEKVVFGPCSEKQRLVLQDDTTDLLLVGGGAGKQ